MGTRRTVRHPKSAQLTALARMRAVEVLPVPLGPTNSSSMAETIHAHGVLDVSTTARWPTI